MNAILKAPVDLFWNGGIGTYVKASRESQAEAQDRLNDAIRVNGAELRCRVVGEGGNLGCTQKGRVEFALHGGRINTDFIDNSAGVDCSDHEVNIKILLRAVLDAGDLTLKQRDELLASMTDEVAALVLRDNVLQNLALSMTEQLGPELLEAQTRLMRRLQDAGRLDREVEQLPSDAELIERRKQGKGLTRPECAVLLAYAKMTLYEDFLRTEIPDRAHLANDIAKYFPRPVRRRFANEIAQHRLKREIIATWIANSVVNRGLAVFVSELEDETGNSLEDIMTAYVVSRDSFGLLGVWGAIEALPASVPGDVQTRLLVAVRSLLIRGTRWFMAQVGRPLRIGDTVGRFRPRIETVMRQLDDVLGPEQVASIEAARVEYEQAGVEREWPRRWRDCRKCWRRATSCAWRRPTMRRRCCGRPGAISRSRVRSTCRGSRPGSRQRHATGAGSGWRLPDWRRTWRPCCAGWLPPQCARASAGMTRRRRSRASRPGWMALCWPD